MIEFFLHNDLLFKSLAIYVVFGLSMQVVLRAGVFSLASAGFWGISAYTTALLVNKTPTVLAIAAGVALSMVAAVGLLFLLGRLRGLYLGMATIAFDLLVVSVILNWETVTGGAMGLYGIPQELTLWVAVAVAISCVVIVALWHARSGGRVADVLRVDEPLAQSLGINATRVRYATLVLSAFLGAISGSMAALTYGVLSPLDSGFALVVLGLTIVVIGGSSSWVGAVLGAIVVTFLPELLAFVSEWRDLVYGILIVVVLLFAPRGLSGLLERLSGYWKTSRRSRSTPLAGQDAPLRSDGVTT